MIQDMIKKVIKKFSATQVQYESLVALDFKMCDEKSGLMQMCFSLLANWPLALIFVIMYFNPFRYQFSIQSFFLADSRIMAWAYSENFMMAFVIFALIGSLISIEILWLTLIAWLISNGEIHVLISVGAAAGIIFSAARKNLKLISLIETKMKNTWMFFSLVQMISVCAASAISYFLYLNLKNFNFFSSSMTINRYEFFVLTVFIQYLTQFGLLGIWGHFYSRRKIEPADWKISYTTAEIIRKLNLSRSFRSELLLFCNEKLEIKSTMPILAGIPDRLQKLSNSETEYLKKAVQNLK